MRFITAAALVNELLEARDEKRVLRVQKQLTKQDLLIVDQLGYVPLSKTGAELLFEIFGSPKVRVGHFARLSRGGCSSRLVQQSIIRLS